MDVGTQPPTGLDTPGLVVRERQCRLDLESSAATQQHLAAYLALVDRPVTALLARERLRQLGPGLFRYSSRPFRLLQFELLPSLELRVDWVAGELCLRCSDCRIQGLGRWERVLRFGLLARLQPAPGRLNGLATVSLALPPVLPAWARSLAGTALEQVLDRIERRLERGLRKDLLTWLLDPAVSG